MNFSEAVLTCLKQKFVNFNDRARRSEYWYFSLFCLMVNIVTSVIDGVIGISILGTIASLALLLPSLGVSVRRLHDVNRSGWWLLICLTGIGAFYILYLACKEGDHGDNQYGPDPKGDINDDNTVAEDRKIEIEKMGGDSVI